MARNKVYYGAKGLLDLAEDMDKSIASTVKTMDDAVRYLAEEGRKDADDLTSGRLTPRQTRGQYARRAAGRKGFGRQRGSAKPLPINVKSGRLHRSFLVKKAGKRTYDVLSAHVPYAKFILSPSGTVKMIARPLKREVGKRGKARMYAIKRKLFKSN